MGQAGVDFVQNGDEQAIGLTVARQANYYPTDYGVRPCPVHRGLSDGDLITVGQIELRVIETPGHSVDSICFHGFVDDRYVLWTGDAIQFGSSTWRVEAIDRERVTVSPAPGAPARMPFWKGGLFGRDYELGQALGAFRRELAAHVHREDAVEWVRARYPVDVWSAENLVQYVRDALERGGAVATLPDGSVLLMHGITCILYEQFDSLRIPGLAQMYAVNTLGQSLLNQP